MDHSEAELSIGTLPSSRNTLRYCSWFTLYFKPSAVLPFGRTVVPDSCFFIHVKYSSTNGLIEFCRSWRRSCGGRSFKVPSSSYINAIRFKPDRQWNVLLLRHLLCLLLLWHLRNHVLRGPYSSSRIRPIIPEVLLFQENCQHQCKSAILNFESRITITTFYLKNSGMLFLPLVFSKWELSLRNHLSFHDLSCLFMVSCVISVYIWVVCKDTCPRKFLTTIRGTPASIIWVAVVCLMECGV